MRSLYIERQGYSTIRWFVVLVYAVVPIGCANWTDPATRLASQLEAASRQLGAAEGSHYTLVHAEPSMRGECEGPYKVQLDRVGALIVWCFDEAGKTTAGGSTTHHSNFVKTAQTFIIKKPAHSSLRIELERQGDKAVIVGAS